MKKLLLPLLLSISIPSLAQNEIAWDGEYNYSSLSAKNDDKYDGENDGNNGHHNKPQPIQADTNVPFDDGVWFLLIGVGIYAVRKDIKNMFK